MKIIRVLLTVVVTAGCGLSLHAEVIDGIKVIVHDSIVTKHEVEAYSAQAEEALRQKYRSQPEAY